MNILNSFLKNAITAVTLMSLLVLGFSTQMMANHNSHNPTEGDEDVCAGIVHLAITLDDNAEEISWTLFNTDRYVKVADGEYFTTEDNYETVETAVCLSAGCYELTIYDSWGDGIESNQVKDIITLMDKDGTVLLNSGGDFGDYITIQFCTQEDGTLVASPDRA